MTNTVVSPCERGLIARATAAPCKQSHKPFVLAATILGSSMVFIDGTVVNVVLPLLQTDLKASASDAQWIMESYALMLAALLLVGGVMGDVFGRRRIYTWGIIVFTVASVACGLAETSAQLIVARAAQGVGGALVVPGSLAIIGATFSEEERGRAIGLWSGATALTMSLGPVLGGWLAENLSWPWIFFINVPLALPVLGILFVCVPESSNSDGAPLDWKGAILATIGLGAFVFALTEANRLGLSHPLVGITFLAGLFGMVSFIVHLRRASSPMIPLHLFRSQTFTGANVMTLFLYAALGGLLFFLPFNLIEIQGYSATGAAAALLPLVILLGVLSRWSGGLVDRYGARLPLVIGPSIATLGFAGFAWPSIGGVYWLTFFPAIFVLGVGMSISVAPLTTAVMTSVDERFVGIASGINNAVSRTAALLALAIMGLIYLEIANSDFGNRLIVLDLPTTIKSQLLEQSLNFASLDMPTDVADADRDNIQSAASQAFVHAFRAISLLAAALAALSALVAGLMIKPGRLDADEPRQEISPSALHRN